MDHCIDNFILPVHALHSTVRILSGELLMLEKCYGEYPFILSSIFILNVSVLKT